MNSSKARPTTRRKRGVVGVILRDERMLVIRRSLTVTAPGMLCLPGGTIEEGESECEALVREMQEELLIDVEPIGLCYRSVTAWGTNLAWWQAELSPAQVPKANPDEVAEYFWCTRDELRSASDALPSLPEFVAAWESGMIKIDASWR
ncbi:NUDIX hydrolase [Stieleria varia]|uniref:8-oxo-dGTP diphosphatase n=1 Tax=Stieleria varia TaxID=2528005 RepID=A0A5C6B8S7_9BACT|nr:NUDIX domain-containing protein [Stieleria varia]TWU07709.1 hypothetical protein Pla52n_02820 [Stieleria varia]